MAEKGVDHLCCIHDGADVQTQNAEKEQNLCIHKTAGTPEISKALAESNLTVLKRQSESANFRQQTMGDKAPKKTPTTHILGKVGVARHLGNSAGYVEAAKCRQNTHKENDQRRWNQSRMLIGVGKTQPEVERSRRTSIGLGMRHAMIVDWQHA